MIEFRRIRPEDRPLLEPVLAARTERPCEYGVSNLFLWGEQYYAFLGNNLLFFSRFGEKTVYPFPVIRENPRQVVDALAEDSRRRGVPLQFALMSGEDCDLLQSLYPGRFSFRDCRDAFDYVYSVESLAGLKGRKLQKKRNHVNKFRANHPLCRVIPLDGASLARVRAMTDRWLEERMKTDPDIRGEQLAMDRAYDHFEALGMVGVALEEEGRILAMSMGSRLNPDTVDVHFEKALESVDGAYAAVNQAFAARIGAELPGIRWLNREEDMGIPGLRQAKLSYWPDRMIEKFRAEEIGHDL